MSEKFVFDHVGVGNMRSVGSDYELHQNYPDPFNLSKVASREAGGHISNEPPDFSGGSGPVDAMFKK